MLLILHIREAEKKDLMTTKNVFNLIYFSFYKLYTT